MVTREEVFKHLADHQQQHRVELMGEQCLNASYNNWDDKLIYPECYIHVDRFMSALYRFNILTIEEWEKW